MLGRGPMLLRSGFGLPRRKLRRARLKNLNFGRRDWILHNYFRSFSRTGVETSHVVLGSLNWNCDERRAEKLQ